MSVTKVLSNPKTVMRWGSVLRGRSGVNFFPSVRIFYFCYFFLQLNGSLSSSSSVPFLFSVRLGGSRSVPSVEDVNEGVKKSNSPRVSPSLLSCFLACGIAFRREKLLGINVQAFGRIAFKTFQGWPT